MKHRFSIVPIAILTTAALLALLPGRSTRAAGSPYAVTILNKSGAVPCDLSADGRIAGEVGGHAFYWSPANQYTDLTPDVSTESRAVRVNSSGVVIGWSDGGHTLWLWDAAHGRRSLDALHNGGADGWQLVTPPSS